ncbi:nitrate reductase [Marinomonas sp. 15G1-11]|uniref:Nitrate reductase n=1 Tax=Marinomonas phaeophyticola TaxID=3004091 RepID=A0ABT4JYE8_9GAMM|nr:nitrate reductase [Marinomonas sp. 15G1-11]MCZ2723410.1 nitrate reductase [Marinomonas sp. 15G1-11]
MMQPKAGKTTCPYCGVGCGVLLKKPTSIQGKIDSVVGDKEHPANFGRLCVKGSNLSETLTSDGRLATPKVNGENVSWSTATDFIAKKIQQVTHDYGADAFAFYLSGQILTEDYYVANKLAKGFIGTANVDTNSRLCMASAVVGYKRAFGSDTVPCSYEDLECCDLLIMVGSNAAWTHPVLYQRIAAAKALRPQMKVVVIDPRKTATCDIADLHLAIAPGTDAYVFSLLLAESHRHDVLDVEFIANKTDGYADALAEAILASPSIDVIAKTLKVDRALLDTLVKWWLDTPKTVSFYSQGVNQSATGVDKCNAIINCHLATGRIGKEGMGPFSITGQPNAMGGREVGGLANQLAAHMDFTTPGAIDLVQRFWNAPNLATENGLKAIDMFQAMESGKIKVIWIMSTNPMVSIPDTAQVKRALEQCELVIVSDCQEVTDTNAFADVLLPATGWSEKDGTVTNSERRISRQRGILPPFAESKHDWWAITQVAHKMGFESAFPYKSPHEIFIEHAALSDFENNGQRDFNIGALKALTKAEYDSLMPIQWPVTPNSLNGTQRMFSDGRFFTENRRAKFIAIRPQKPQLEVRDRYPFVLNTGRVRDQWHTMTRTGKSPTLANHTQEPYVELHKTDAERLGITHKTLVRVFNETGEIVVPAKVASSWLVQQGQVFVPIHWNQAISSKAVVSNLISQIVDPLSGQPESKHGVVNIEPVKNLLYGTLLSSTKLDVSDCLYHCEIKQSSGVRYEVALDSKTQLDEFVRHQVSVAFMNETLAGCWSEYKNTLNGDQRFVYLIKDVPVAVFYFSKTTINLDRSWLSSLLLGSDGVITDAISPMSETDKLALSVGYVACSEDKGQIVCSCFNVGEKQIQKAIVNGVESVRELGDRLQCGTNCGSCIPELKSFLALNNEVAL